MPKYRSGPVDKKVNCRRVLCCKSCGSDNIFSEVIVEKEWSGPREVIRKIDHNTCVECGEEWDT